MKIPILYNSMDDHPIEGYMSSELYQNAVLTMGEIRDFLHVSGVSWDFILSKLQQTNTRPSSIEKRLNHLSDYSTGMGKNLKNLPSNIP